MRSTAFDLVDRGLVPDAMIRFGIRRLLRRRLRTEWNRAESDPVRRHESWAERLATEPIAPAPVAANEQHYEVPPEFFELVLGPRLKYSSGFFASAESTLAEAEEAMLELTAERAGVQDGDRVLDLGCGWGSFSLWLAERFPTCEIVAVSNSRPQGEFVESRARKRGLRNVEHRVAQVGELELPPRSFDRVVSVEMFEHLRNYRALLGKIGRWLRPQGSLFVHIFCHQELTYTFEDRGGADWMSRHFFTGGLMPAAGLLPTFDGDLQVRDRWLIDGTHYQKTAEGWLANLDGNKAEIRAVFDDAYPDRASVWLERWRVFFMACAELFGLEGGAQWKVAHYRFESR